MSSSVHELRRRLRSLEEAIDLQIVVLRHLERQRSDVQNELDSLRVPTGMARLPPEISSDILLQSIPTPPTWESLTTLLSVCRGWNALALATPFLWSTITDTGVMNANFVHVLEKWLHRTGSLQLSLILRHINRTTFPRTLQTLEAHTPRIQNLHLSPLHDSDLKLMTYPFDGLRSLTIYGSRISPDLCVELLRRTPNLMDLSLLQVKFHPASTPMRLTHLTLQSLHLGRPGEWCWSETSILRLLTLPALQSLVISRNEVAVEDLFNFLTRSAPPLRHLHVRLQEEDAVNDGIVACLQLVPGLIDLDILLGFYGDSHSSFDLWARSPKLLPGLRNLVIEEYYNHAAEGYRRVLAFLAERRGRLGSLQLILSDQVLDDAVAAALRVFRDEGMDIHVGTWQKSFL
ncbi:hypothetical protein FB45DRAFT_1112666 [Roridomyces roridus]|uniref:F-box domain-containing protein n=1 Tax=Roridomyces roridus TaxID=1738132 RepID=A0AAD7B7E1_9AGAR|nr:hypothetical protein FB45DRAFT_1112666 [Roridomyces roridus]